MRSNRAIGLPSMSRRQFGQGAALSLAGLALGACTSRFEHWERGPFAVLLDESPDLPHEASRRLAAFSSNEARRSLSMTVQRVAADADALPLLRTLATGQARMIIAAGPRAGRALATLAPTLPHQRFTWLAGLTAATAPMANVATYRLRAGEPAWLAGLLAAGRSRRRVIAVEPAADPVLTAFAGAARHADSGIRVIDPGTGNLAARLDAARAGGADVLLTRVDARDAATRQRLADSGLQVIVIDPDGTSTIEAAPWLVGRLVIDQAPLVDALFQDCADSVWRGGLERSVGLRQPALLRLEMASDTPAALRAQLEQAELDLITRRIDPLAPDGVSARRPPF